MIWHQNKLQHHWYTCGKAVDVWTQSIYAVSGSDTFKITLNSEFYVILGAAEPAYKLDVLGSDVIAQQAFSKIENFTIEINSADKGANIQTILHLQSLTLLTGTNSG